MVPITLLLTNVVVVEDVRELVAASERATASGSIGSVGTVIGERKGGVEVRIALSDVYRVAATVSLGYGTGSSVLSTLRKGELAHGAELTHRTGGL